VLLALNAQSSPIVTRLFSTMRKPSSKRRLPTRTPKARQASDLNGVPLRTLGGCTLSFQ
jgi:hypothetical protein